MQGRRFQETGGVFSAIRRGFLGTENNPDAGRSFAAVDWHYSDRLLGSEGGLHLLPVEGEGLRRFLRQGGKLRFQSVGPGGAHQLVRRRGKQSPKLLSCFP